MNNTSYKQTTNSHHFSQLENMLILILRHREWVYASEICDEVHRCYQTPVKDVTILRTLRMLREKDFFVFTQRYYGSTRYKLCDVNDVSNVHKFFDITKEYILTQHSQKNSWNNMI